ARWIAPGVRWRVTEIRPGSRFEFEVHADTLGQADAPQKLRSELLGTVKRVAVADPAALSAVVNRLAPGERRLIEARFAPGDSAAQTLDGRDLFWHPLAATARGFTALVAASEHPFD